MAGAQKDGILACGVEKMKASRPALALPEVCPAEVEDHLSETSTNLPCGPEPVGSHLVGAFVPLQQKQANWNL